MKHNSRNYGAPIASDVFSQLKDMKATKAQSIAYEILTYLLTYLLYGAANRFSASQKIPPILWSAKVHYRIHKCPPPVTILSQLDSAHAPISHLLKIHLNIILPSRSGSSK